MSRCSRCDIEVRGDWTDCPLCGAGLRSVTEPTPAPWPDVPPRFDVGQLLRVLLLVSVLIVVSVTMDTINQIQSHLLAHQYEGLIEKSQLRGKKRSAA